MNEKEFVHYGIFHMEYSIFISVYSEGVENLGNSRNSVYEIKLTFKRVENVPML